MNAPSSLWHSPEFWWTCAILLGVLFCGFGAVIYVKRWRRRYAVESTDTLTELGSFREMARQGELSQEEYQRIVQVFRKNVVAPEPPPQDKLL